MTDEFRVESNPFKSLAWTTDVMYTSGMLARMANLPELSVGSVFLVSILRP
jgi:hypothetical protein